LYIIFAVSLFSGNDLFSQRGVVDVMREVNLVAARNSIGGLSYEDIEGSPYYTDEFIDGTIYLKNGNSATLPLRYNLLQDEIEFHRDKQILWITKSAVIHVQYGQELLIPESFSENPGKTTYFFAHEKGKYDLYIRKQVNFSPR
jgi:hypothetical protein